jgi:hypothetical protein
MSFLTFLFGQRNDNDDGSRIKASTRNGGDTLKTEKISSKEKPHSHDIVLVDKPSGQVKEISNSPNFKA